MDADKIVDSGKIPKEWEDAADEVADLAVAGHSVADDPNHPDSAALAAKRKEHGLHAYRYEVCGDGSVVALYSNTADGEVKMAAFADMEAASAWTPRDER